MRPASRAGLATEVVPISTPSPDQAAFEPTVGREGDSGPSWRTYEIKASLKRISAGGTVELAHAQAVTEVVILLHSIRRILMWTAVIIPLVLAAAGVTLAITAANTASSSCVYSTYSSRC